MINCFAYRHSHLCNKLRNWPSFSVSHLTWGTVLFAMFVTVKVHNIWLVTLSCCFPVSCLPLLAILGIQSEAARPGLVNIKHVEYLQFGIGKAPTHLGAVNNFIDNALLRIIWTNIMTWLWTRPPMVGGLQITEMIQKCTDVYI